MSGQPGFSLLEIVTVIAVIGILLAVAIDRMLPYIDEAERIAVIRMEGQLRSTLMLEAAGRIARGRSTALTDLNDGNPVQFLLEPPKNYLGGLHAPAADETPARHWYFDTATKRLTYRPGKPFGQRAEGTILENPAFSVRVEFADTNGDGRFQPQTDELFGVRLARVAGMEWLTAPGGEP